MNFTELINATYDELRYSSSPTATVTARIKRWLNEGYGRAVRLPALKGLRDVDTDFDTVAAQQTYGIQSLEWIDKLTNLDNGVALTKRSIAWMREQDPQETASGTPEVWCPRGYQPVRLQPASTGLWVVSSAAGDTTQTARIIGTRANGDRQAQATATLTGLTRAPIGTFTDFTNVLLFEINTSGVGTISLYDAATSGHELARIPIGSTAVQYLMLRLWPTPAAAETIRVAGRLVLSDLVNDVSLFRLPPSFTELLLVYTRACHARREKDLDLFKTEMGMFESGIHQMAGEVEYSGGWNGDRDTRPGRPSNLGGFYPRDQEWP